MPASISACVTVCVAVQVIAAPGANDEPLAGVQTRSRDFRIRDRHAVSVTFPVLVATIV